VLSLCQPRLKMQQQYGIVIETRIELAPDLPKIIAIESEIREALTNLVFNAVDAMPDGGTLIIRTRTCSSGPVSQNVVIESADNGQGMDEDTRQHCLEPFFTTKGERGTGLGLAMVYGMVQRQNGELEIDSAPATGTTVRLIFPAVADLATVSEKPPAKTVPTGLRLLVVDDEPNVLMSLQHILETDGHSVVTANSGQNGIDTLLKAIKHEQPFDAVITDLGMPYIDGRRVAAAVKQAAPSTPVILLTGWGNRIVAENDIPPHVDYVLSKPPKLQELRDTLAICCASEPPAIGYRAPAPVKVPHD
ncbi:MAG: ATP-binding protein, partial [Gammaproteobacteria bacterium]